MYKHYIHSTFIRVHNNVGRCNYHNVVHFGSFPGAIMPVTRSLTALFSGSDAQSFSASATKSRL